MRPLLALLAVSLLGACEPTSAASNTDYPALLPLEQILLDNDQAAAPPDALSARAAALRAKADGLRGPVIPEGLPQPAGTAAP